MDEIRAFFNNTAPISSRVVKFRGPLTDGALLTKEDPFAANNRRQEHCHSVVPSGTDYAREVKERETNIYLKNEVERENLESITGGLESMEHLSLFGASVPNIGELTDEAMTDVYSKYSFKMKEDSSKLVIEDYKQKILDRIRGFPVVIIEGPTGCGKTTQVPQWILDECYQNRKPCKIIVTQPRRIAAMTIAKRVAQERGWDLGGLVGYQVGLDNKTSSDTRIHYVTTGVLLQKLVKAKNMNEYSHIILDEVHERGQEMDFLLLVVKRLLYTVSPGVKVVLMSATFNRKAFADYFLIPTPRGLQMSSSIKVIKNAPMFTVKTFYLNHLNKFGSILHNATPKFDEPGISTEMYYLVIKLLNAFEQIDKHEDNVTDLSETSLPSVLIFLPGINEIEDLYNHLMDKVLRKKIVDAECARYNWNVLPLHSTITSEEQARVFHRAAPGSRNIILATNIAESSITVPDIKYVVDFCLMKILVADENTNFTSLQLAWASKTNCEQRAGRAGRVRDGRVYRLVPDKFYDGLTQECPPEIVRCPLERLVLLAKMLDMGPPSDILALAMDPPDMSNIHRTILVLKEMGALKPTLNGKWCASDGDMTYLGRIMANLPIDVRASKLIVLGYTYGLLDEAIVMAAAMSIKNVFNSPFRERMTAYYNRLIWADGSTSDIITFLHVHKVWSHLRQQRYFSTDDNARTWTRRFYLQSRALSDLNDLVRELKMRLTREGIETFGGASTWAKEELNLALKVIIAGAFYPQYFVQVSEDEERERNAVRTLGGNDPRYTVYLKNFPDDQPGEVYATSLKNIIRHQIGEEPRVTFDKNSRKVYLTFNEEKHIKREKCNNGDPTIPGEVVLPVYKAIKARQLRMDIRLPLLPIEKAKQLKILHDEMKASIDITKLVPRLPEVDDTYFPLKISHKVNLGRFWVQYDDESTASELHQIFQALNNSKLQATTETVRPGRMFAAPHSNANGVHNYRARVLRLVQRDMAEVQYIDWGFCGRVNLRNLMELPGGVCKSTPPLAMYCALAGVAPSPLLEAHAQWTRAASGLVDRLSIPPLLAKVYSVSHGVVSIELLADEGLININKELLRLGHAVPCEEGYDSKVNHDLRQTASILNMSQKRAFNRDQVQFAYCQIQEIDAPNGRECDADVCLHGPFSPLETKVNSLMYASINKQVQIEWNSVNSVLLDTEPQGVYERLLVAGTVSQNESTNKLTLRHTTLMPNIHGLPAILALLFCPTAEFRCDPGNTRYVSALCGLGSHEGGAPYFPEHDVLVDMDAEFTTEDISQINHIRHLMDFMIYCNEGQDTPAHDDESRSQVGPAIRQDLMKLLKKRRKRRETEIVPKAWEWGTVDRSRDLELETTNVMDKCVIYPLHSPQEIVPISREELLKLRKDTEKLRELVTRTCMSSGPMVECKLCGTTAMSVAALRIHLYSNGHAEREEIFRELRS